jgi:hypothetical protein
MDVAIYVQILKLKCEYVRYVYKKVHVLEDQVPKNCHLACKIIFYCKIYADLLVTIHISISNTQ